jgi:hypothetical protein
MASKEFLSRQSKLSPQSEEWSQLEYNLQLTIGSTTLVLRAVWSVANAFMSSQFDRKARSPVVLDSWLNVDEMDKENSLDEVSTGGFKFPRRGLVFPTGTIKTPSESSFTYNRVYDSCS